MSALKSCGVLLSLLLIQVAFCKPFPQPQVESEAEAIAQQKFSALINEYSAKLVNIARDILNDEALDKNNDRDIKDFKQSITWIVIKYNASTGEQSKAEVIEYFVKLAENFEKIPEEKVTNQIRIMQEILQRYGMMKLTKEMEKAFDNLM